MASRVRLVAKLNFVHPLGLRTLLQGNLAAYVVLLVAGIATSEKAFYLDGQANQGQAKLTDEPRKSTDR
jgi:hypothetical protein